MRSNRYEPGPMPARNIFASVFAVSDPYSLIAAISPDFDVLPAPVPFR